MAITVERIELISVGIDVGSSTSHLVFSKLVLKKDPLSPSRRFKVVEREILYEGEIIDTPLIDKTTIDVKKLSEFFKREYEKAGINPANVNTGAVIVTGETAKKQNAKEIVEAISEDAGKFVAATAGPNFESLIAALGSGMVERSKGEETSILSTDIGGGTSNMAISVNGEVVSTACISVGGRLLAVDNDHRILRIDGPAKIVMDELGMTYEPGDKIEPEEVNKVASVFAKALIEVISGPTRSPITKQLMMTSDLDFAHQIKEFSFSGGVAEFIYGNDGKYNDIGHVLAAEIKRRISDLPGTVVEPENKIRATVIGAGAYSLSISGSTAFMDNSLSFPLKNVPVIRVDVDRERLSIQHVKEEVKNSFERFDLNEGEEIVALYFKDPVRAAYAKLKLFAQAIEQSLPNSIEQRIPIILIFERDIANSVGNVIRRESDIKENLLSIDELSLEEGDWIDVGAPLVSGQVFPVTVKSLVFNQDK